MPFVMKGIDRGGIDTELSKIKPHLFRERVLDSMDCYNAYDVQI